MTGRKLTKKEYNRLYYEKNKERLQDRSRKYHRRMRKEEPERDKHYMLKYRYGITGEEYNALLVQQNNACAICEKSCSTGRDLAVDHCHDTGKVRGLLCAACNLAIGKLNDDPLLLEKAAEYLRSVDSLRSVE